MKKNKGRDLVKRICNPPAGIILLLIPVSAALLVPGLSDRFHGTALAYLSYLVSSYTLAVGVWGFSKGVRSLVHGFWDIPLIHKMNGHPLGHLLLNDIAFRGTALIYQGLAVNGAYAVFRGIAAYLYRSVWFAATAFYYLFLGAVRMALVFHVRRLKRYPDPQGRMLLEYKGYRTCGFFMLLLNMGMAGMVVLMVRDHQHYEYPGYVIYLSALYTFYTAITATINLLKFRKRESPILSASKAITFTGAMMSVMVLQTALIAEFGGDDSVFRQTANTATGAFVCIGSAATAFFMIYRGTYHIKKMEKEKGKEQSYHEGKGRSVHL